jgi:hypothetical protein
VRVDLLEFKTYDEIDLGESPVVVLSYGHIFTAESLDGLVGLGNVYHVSPKTGEYVDLKPLKEETGVLKVPRCPDSKIPVRLHATRRYNRVVNAAVMDEMSKRFLVQGLADLKDLDTRINEVETLLPATPASQSIASPEAEFKKRHAVPRSLLGRAERFCSSTAEKQQPAKKLYDATINAMADQQSINSRVAGLSLDDGNGDPPRCWT